MPSPSPPPARLAFGARRDPHDHLDHMFDRSLAEREAAGPALSPRGRCPPVWWQGRVWSCSAHAVAAAVHLAQERDGRVEPSHPFLLHSGRQSDGAPRDSPRTVGASVRATINAAAHPQLLAALAPAA
jgi:hypothetical protein